jgi:hypothetical protein
MARGSTGFIRLQLDTVGLTEFARELARVDSRFDEQFRRVFADVTDLMVVRSQSGSPERLRAAISPAETARAARVRLSRRPPDALARFFGAKRRTGWFASMYADVSKKHGPDTAEDRFPDRQFPPWVGNQWDPGETGGVPYHVGPAVNSAVPEAIDLLLQGLDRIFERAFSD